MEFYKKMIKTELKQMFYWMACATESAKKGEKPFYDLNVAAQHAAKINEYMSILETKDETDGAIDWEKLTDWAIKQARAEIEQENND